MHSRADVPGPAFWRRRELWYPALVRIVNVIACLIARIQIHGLEHLPRSGPVVLMANHTSHLDPLVIVSVAHRRRRRVRFLAVSGLWSVPVVGWLLRAGRMIEVRRGGGVERMVEAASAALDADQCVVVYPEGTIVAPGQSRPARPGAGLLALRADAPVLPLSIVGLEPWTGGLPRLRQRVEVAIGPPVDLSPWQDGEPDRSAMLAAAGHVLDRIVQLGTTSRSPTVNDRPRRLRDRRALLALTVGGALIEALILLAAGSGSAPLAVHVTAPPPFGTFHDLRWVLTHHPSWLAFVLQAAVAVAFRGSFIAAAIRTAWPPDRSPPVWRTLLVRGWVFAAVASLLLLPWAGFLFGLAVTPVSWLFLAGVVPVLVLGAVIHDGAVAPPWWRLPTLRTMAWTVLAFVVLSAGGGAVHLAPVALVPVAVALTGLFHAWAWHSIVLHVAFGARRESPFPLVPIAVGVLLVVFVGVSALAFDVIVGDVRGGPFEPPAAGDAPVLVANGFSSRWDGRQLDLLDRPYDEVKFSYRGLDADGRPLPYDAAHTHRSLRELASEMAVQVEALHERTGRDVSVIAQSEGSLVAVVYAAAHDLAHVDRILLLSPLIEPGGVYYPPRGADGWGVAGGWVLRGLTGLVSAISPYEADPDLPFVRSVVDRGPVLSPLPGCMVPGVRTAMLVPLDTALASPRLTEPQVPVHVVPAFHAGFLEPGSSNTTVRALLEGRPAPHLRTWTVTARLGSALGAGWQVPRVSTSLPPAWHDDHERFRSGDGPGCQRVRAAVRAWVASG